MREDGSASDTLCCKMPASEACLGFPPWVSRPGFSWGPAPISAETIADTQDQAANQLALWAERMEEAVKQSVLETEGACPRGAPSQGSGLARSRGPHDPPYPGPHVWAADSASAAPPRSVRLGLEPEPGSRRP